MIIFKKPKDIINYKFRIKLNGHLLEPSNFIKYLGVYLDPTLNWKHHCSILSKKLKRANGMLMKIRHFVPKRELTSIYSALFLSHLTYGSQIWGQSKTIYSEKAFRLQNRAQRIIDFADFRAEVKPIYKRNKMLNLEDQINVQNCLFVFDYFKGSLPRSFNGYFTRINEVHSRETISSNLGLLYAPHFSTTRYGMNSFIKKCIVNWNFFSRYFGSNLSSFERSSLKRKLETYFLNAY